MYNTNLISIHVTYGYLYFRPVLHKVLSMTAYSWKTVLIMTAILLYEQCI